MAAGRGVSDEGRGAISVMARVVDPNIVFETAACTGDRGENATA